MSALRKKDFIFTRHGETDANAKKLCQGHIDYPLNAVGKAQAEIAATKLMGRAINTLYCSPLIRAHQTALIIADKLHVTDIILIDELKERAWGSLEGKPNTELYAQEKLEADNPQETVQPKILGLEPAKDFQERILKTMNNILVNSDSHCIVGHGRFFFSLCELMEVPPIKQIANGVTLQCEVSNGQWSVTTL